MPAALLLAASSASFALTLGRAQGLALIGRPLEVTIPLGLDGPADAGELCTEAEVFYGETRVDARRVELRSTTTGSTATVRVRVSAPVDEAYATVFLRVGCAQKLIRRYVLLSEQPADVVEASAQPTPAAPAISPVGSLAAPAEAPGAATRSPAAPAVAGRPSPVAEGSAAPRRPAAARPAPKPAAPAPEPAPAAVARPRLKLDAIEVRPQAAGSAQATASLASASAASAQVRADLASQMQAFNVPNEEVQRNAERILALEADLKALRDGMAKRDSALTDLRQRLDQAERDRYANPLVYGLAALLALAAVLMALLLRRRATGAAGTAGSAGGSWWDDSHGPGPGLGEGAGAIDDRAGVSTLPVAGANPAMAAPQTPEADAAQAPHAAGTAEAADTAAKLPLPLRLDDLSRSADFADSPSVRVSDPLPLTSSELSDMQQEADFFVSLGEHDRAIEVLRNHIEVHPQASAVAWLALLEIHHTLGRLEAYEQLRRDFEWLFNVHAPAFTSFAEDSRGLSDYPRLLARLQAVWPSPAAQQVIDDALFRRTSSDNDETLTLQAYRDLLFLHDIATELNAGNKGAAAQAGVLDIDLEALQRQAEVPMPPPLVVPVRTDEARGLDFQLTPSDLPYTLPPKRTER